MNDPILHFKIMLHEIWNMLEINGIQIAHLGALHHGILLY